MTVMRFDPRQGWYNPHNDVMTIPSRTRRTSQPIPVARDKANEPIETRDFFTLLDQARNGDVAARAELALRGNNFTR